MTHCNCAPSARTYSRKSWLTWASVQSGGLLHSDIAYTHLCFPRNKINVGGCQRNSPEDECDASLEKPLRVAAYVAYVMDTWCAVCRIILNCEFALRADTLIKSRRWLRYAPAPASMEHSAHKERHVRWVRSIHIADIIMFLTRPTEQKHNMLLNSVKTKQEILSWNFESATPCVYDVLVTVIGTSIYMC